MVKAMEIGEKLDIFYKAAMDAANMQSETILEEQKQIYQREIHDYEMEKQRNWKEKKKQRETLLRREANRMIQKEVMQQKQAYYDAAEAKKQEIFAAVEQRLEAYRLTASYEQQLERLVEQAVSFAEGAELVIYLSPSDRERKTELEQNTRQQVRIDEDEFGGGIRAVIKEKNILMDESFHRRLQQQWEQYEL